MKYTDQWIQTVDWNIKKMREVLHFAEARKYWLTICKQEMTPSITNLYLDLQHLYYLKEHQE